MKKRKYSKELDVMKKNVDDYQKKVGSQNEQIRDDSIKKAIQELTREELKTIVHKKEGSAELEERVYRRAEELAGFTIEREED